MKGMYLGWNLNRSWPIKEDFVYNMSFRKETGNEQEDIFMLM